MAHGITMRSIPLLFIFNFKSFSPLINLINVLLNVDCVTLLIISAKHYDTITIHVGIAMLLLKSGLQLSDVNSKLVFISAFTADHNFKLFSYYQFSFYLILASVFLASQCALFIFPVWLRNLGQVQQTKIGAWTATGERLHRRERDQGHFHQQLISER